MAVFVELTDVARTQRNGSQAERVVYVNPEAIDAILVVQPGSTRLFLRSGGEGGYFDVRESPQEVIRVFELAQKVARVEKGEKS